MSEVKNPVWELRKDNILLGVLDHASAGWPWTKSQFHAEPEFEAYRPLFAEELQLFDRNEFDSAAWGEVYRKITSLGLTLNEQGSRQMVRQFKLHIRDDEGWFRLSRID